MTHTLTETLFTVLEAIGTVAFAVSGATVALQRRLDVFGVMLLGLTTALGGGCIRDLLLGRTPPVMFSQPLYAIVAIVTSLVVFLLAYFWRGIFFSHMVLIDRVNNVFDALGLGMFTVIGVRAGVAAGYGDNAFLCVFLGLLTGVGGGVLEILADPVFQFFGLAHIDDLLGLVPHDIHAGSIGQRQGLFFQFFKCHGVSQRRAASAHTNRGGR